MGNECHGRRVGRRDYAGEEEKPEAEVPDARLSAVALAKQKSWLYLPPSLGVGVS